MKEQEYRWAQKLGQNRREHPNMSTPELERLTKSQVADPRTGFGGHQTGGAVDVTLCRSDGTEYDMGTGYSALSPEIKTSSKKILLTQRKNREILKMCMEKAGFINYPNEWWHYCYGDRMWAAYSKRKTCFYGLPEKGDSPTPHNRSLTRSPFCLPTPCSVSPHPARRSIFYRPAPSFTAPIHLPPIPFACSPFPASILPFIQSPVFPCNLKSDVLNSPQFITNLSQVR